MTETLCPWCWFPRKWAFAWSTVALSGLLIAASACGSDAAPGMGATGMSATGASPPQGAAGMGSAVKPASPPMNPINPMNPPVTTPPPSLPAGMGMAMANPAMTPPPSDMPKPDYAAEGPLEGECPDGFMPSSGMNMGFQTKAGEDRRFIAYLPTASMDAPRPLYVALTGTVQQEDQFASSLASVLNGMGWIVLAPVRRCSNSGQSCYSEGSDGWIWYPWNDGSLDDKWAQEIGPDGHFVEEIARCAAKQWPVDRRRIYIGGISAGGSFTYRNITYNSKFFAGGVPGSGMWYTKTDTGPLVPSGNQELLMANPEGIFDGGCCPRPIMENKLEPMIVIDLWGGASDNWTNPRGNGMLTFDYRPETQAASNYFATQQDNVVYLACSGTQGHSWPMGRDFNAWMADVLLSHPKGTPVADFKMPTSFPQSFSCVRGRFTDHY